MGWTDERVEALKKLWLDGLSASQIAKQLGSGLTRNAVIGKVHRLGLSGRATASTPQRAAFKTARPPRPVTPAVPAPRRVEAVVEQKAVVVVQAVEETGSATVLTLDARMCKWPIGDPSRDGFSFCGRANSDGPYCTHHASMAYQPQQRKAVKRADASDLTRSLRRYI